ncbi:MAG: 2-C-methyl-D-erythritol 4-phosphate cytidylyltransferase, partial [Candidatus Omnitrophica bacterium]|nr:2-C-methyl-D-erythritol 4-phosphate cytidylyltransferase [Candidatus Omnitrophota bacterium]
MKKKVIKAIILAGGSSKRMKLKLPKQLVKIGNKPLLAYTLDVFERSKAVESIILVCHKDIMQRCRNLVKRYNYNKIEQLCAGGASRQQSVFNALRVINGCDYVIVHDGVRPFVTDQIITEAVKAAKRFKAVSCAVPVTDTIVEAKGNFIARTLTRNKLWQIQTPQVFKLDLLIRAHQAAKRNKIFNSTDDAQMV